VITKRRIRPRNQTGYILDIKKVKELTAVSTASASGAVASSSGSSAMVSAAGPGASFSFVGA
jgi:hypothetical protein